MFIILEILFQFIMSFSVMLVKEIGDYIREALGEFRFVGIEQGGYLTNCFSSSAAIKATRKSYYFN